MASSQRHQLRDVDQMTSSQGRWSSDVKPETSIEWSIEFVDPEKMLMERAISRVREVGVFNRVEELGRD